MRSLLPLLLLCACLRPTEVDDYASDTAKADDTGPVTGDCSYFVDADGDGFGDPNETTLGPCDAAPTGSAPNDEDCDDADELTFPDAPESCDDRDNDCDGDVDEDAQDMRPWFVDNDGDGYGAPGSEELACATFDERVDNGDDCDDRIAAVNPSADELCDGIDNNCDALTDDESAVDRFSWYEDLDSDFYGSDESLTLSCTPPEGNWVNQGGDCDDGASTVNPGQEQFFSASEGGSYDYNCDTVEEVQYPDPGTCDDSSGTCLTTEGFYLTVPDCGGGALWVRSCDSACLPRLSGENLIQRCR